MDLNDSPSSSSPDRLAATNAALSLLVAIAERGTSALKSDSEIQLEREILGLRERMARTEADLHRARRDKSALETIEQRKDTELKELSRKESLRHIITGVSSEVRQAIFNAVPLQQQFSEAHPGFVMSVDIRQSTTLMLKARSPKHFARFISVLCEGLREIVFRHHGYYDKFTGDGILAFFPKFLAGEDAGFHVLAAADECHRLFETHYKNNRGCFTAVLKDVGLGIGIDFGEPEFALVGEALTVVGTPVVYACRMSGTASGTTLLNQPAFEEVSHYGDHCSLEEVELEVKHEGRFVCHQASLKGSTPELRPPGWQEFGK